MKINNLQFRKIKESDLEILRRWRMLPEVTRYLFSDPVLTTEGQKQWYNSMKEKGNSLYWIFSFGEVDIGYGILKDIDEKNRRAAPMVYIGEMDYRGKGLGKVMLATLENYAFEHLHLYKLCAQILSENYPSLMSYLKGGWKIEGVLKDHIFKDKLYDIYLLALFNGDLTK